MEKAAGFPVPTVPSLCNGATQTGWTSRKLSLQGVLTSRGGPDPSPPGKAGRRLANEQAKLLNGPHEPSKGREMDSLITCFSVQLFS